MALATSMERSGGIPSPSLPVWLSLISRLELLNYSSGFAGVDGILGVGHVDLTKGTVNNTGTVPTVLDNLFTQGMISEKVLGVYFAPASVSGTGELTFGGYDTSLISSSLHHVSPTTTHPASYYWGIEESIKYGKAPSYRQLRELSTLAPPDSHRNR